PSAAAPASPAVEAPHTSTLAVCGVRRRVFALVLRQGPAGGWLAEETYLPESLPANRSPAQPFNGNFDVGPTYAGCPHCGDRGFFRCEVCGALNCLGAILTMRPGHAISVCGNCPHPMS